MWKFLNADGYKVLICDGVYYNNFNHRFFDSDNTEFKTEHNLIKICFRNIEWKSIKHLILNFQTKK